jgi:hypothetical protein
MTFTRMVAALAVGTLATVGAIGVASAQEVTPQGNDPQPANSIGHGLVRIDASWATSKTLADGSQVLTFAKRASGQWMGEVGPEQTLVVRDINVKRVARAWSRLGHKRATGVPATLTWNTGSNFTAVTVSDPKVTPRGFLRFRLASGAQAPDRMNDVTLNLARHVAGPASIVAQSFPVTSTYALSSTASVVTKNSYAIVASISLSDSGLTCYALTLTQPAPQVSLPNNLKCNTITYTTGQFTMSLPVGSQNGSVLFASNMLVSGSSFTFNAIVASWSQTGN